VVVVVAREEYILTFDVEVGNGRGEVVEILETPGKIEGNLGGLSGTDGEGGRWRGKRKEGRGKGEEMGEGPGKRGTGKGKEKRGQEEGG
jgi:hypothetical protein